MPKLAFKSLKLASLILSLILLASPDESQAQSRVALVIGNGDYKNTARLQNPRNDAEDMAAALRRSNFEVISGVDLDKSGMEAATVRFARLARQADVAVFYYSGHAMQFNGVNYLMPVDARLVDEADLKLMARLDDIVSDLQQAKNIKILVLDSCRDNPLAEQLRRSIGRSRSGGINAGLAKIDSPHGMIVSYATQSGRTADDGSGRNSPYTAALLKHIETNEEIGTVFRRVTADVYSATKQVQLPELSLSLIGEYYLRGRPSTAAAPAAAPQQQTTAALIPPSTPSVPSEARPQPAMGYLPGKTVTWNLPAAYPIDNPHTVNLQAFAKDVADATGGKLQITVHPGASLFKAPEIKRAVATGQAQAGEVLISLHENEDPIFGIDVIPFVATSYPQSYKLWQASKPAIEKKLAAQGLMLLFAVPWGPQGIYAKKDINNIEDMKGLKWRAYNVGTSRIADLVGAQPVTIQAAELPQALATGVVNAFMTSGSTGYDSKAWETMSHFYDTQAWIPKNVTFVNKAAFDALDKTTQAAVLKAAAVAEPRGWKLAEEKAGWYLDQLRANKMKVQPPSDALKSGMLKIGEQLTSDWTKKAGPDGAAVIESYKKM